jgi:mono/diheme cytochrome c family protein
MTVEAQSALVGDYCSGCHNDRTKSGGMTLAALDLAHVDRNPELAEKIIRKLRAGMMPPAGMKRPSAETIKSFASTLESAIDRNAAANPNPGRRSFQRLSQTEYARSIKDLLGLDVTSVRSCRRTA